MSALIGRKRFENLIRFKMSPDNLDLVMEAYRLAKAAHRGQARDNGARYFEHPKSVALILIRELHIYDHEMLVVALLHDVIEDTFLFGAIEEAPKNVRARFGNWVAESLLRLTKDRCGPEEKEERDKRYFAALEGADVRTKILKLVDRLHNLRELHCCSAKKKAHYLQETEEHFLPLAREVAEQVSPPLKQRVRKLHKEMARVCDETRRSLREGRST